MKNHLHQAISYLSLAGALSAAASGQTPLFELYGGAAGDQYGSVVASVGDVDADGTADWAVGTLASGGQVVVYSGATMGVLHTFSGPVAAIAGTGDLDGDGNGDVLVGGGGAANVYSGATGLVLHPLRGGSADFGQSVAAGGQIDGDGVPDLLVGDPYESAVETWGGRVYAFSGATGAFIRSHDVQAFESFTLLGWSVGFLGDVDGDARDEYVAGAPGATSFADSYARAFDGATGAVLWTDANTGTSDEYGFALASVADLSGDGVRDVLIGATQDTGVGCGGCTGKGYVRAVNGASGAQLYQIDNSAGFHYTGYGASIAIVGDLDGSGFEDFAASRPGTEGCSGGQDGLQVRDGESGALILSIAPPAGSGSFGGSLAFGETNGDGLLDLICGSPCSDPSGTSSGAVYVFTLVRDVVSYCTAKVNSQGCTPFIQGVGTPSATIAVPFRIKAFQVLNNKNGLLFYGFAPKATPFQGGTRCVQAPVRRTPVQNSSGNPPPNDCSGFYSYDFNQRIRSGVDPALVVGEEVFCQYWSRDPSSPFTTGLTDGLAFYINPCFPRG